jgi:hypothetical protein
MAAVNFPCLLEHCTHKAKKALNDKRIRNNVALDKHKKGENDNN